MPGQRYCVCGNTRSKDPGVSFHRFPSQRVNPDRRAVWLHEFGMEEEDVGPHTRVCARHFPSGNVELDPTMTVGKRFASPIKKGLRAERARQREEQKQLRELSRLSGKSVTPVSSTDPLTTSIPSTSQVNIACVGEQLQSDFQVHELPSDADVSLDVSSQTQESEPLLNAALLARLEVLEAENAQFNSQCKSTQKHFRIEDIMHSDKLVKFYTGFISYAVFIAFFEFLGPVVEHLNYWGSKDGTRTRHRSRKLDTRNQLFLVLVKLRQNFKLTDLAFCFGLSKSQISRYITTWICFLYQHLKEIDWVPTVHQVSGTLPTIFRERFPNTYAIIDASEVFMETPSDLHMQSSTWSSYKHHNTMKFLAACTPNGAISYISPVYVGSISDVELTRTCGFLEILADKPGVTIMADRGFTIKDVLKELGIDLNIPPFLEGRHQLPAEEVEKGRKIASLRIHVERAIGRLKNYNILKQTIPISMARLTNQIVCVCAFLSNFQPALVPLSEHCEESDVDEYFELLSSESDSSSEESD